MATAEQIALVNRYLPTIAKDDASTGGYGWTDEFIATTMDSMALSPAQAVRYFWYQRVQETAEYIDAGKGLTAIHEQARKMLAYWDSIIAGNPGSMEPPPTETPATENRHKAITFGEIERI